MAPKKGLGRGLGSLFGDATPSAQDAAANDPLAPVSPAPAGTVGGEGVGERLRVTDINPAPEQPRKFFDPDALAALAESIRRYGVLQPITVRRLPRGGYVIIAGERRWRAARMAGLEYIPAHVVEADDRLAAELALIENLQREDLNPIEEAEGYQALIDGFGFTQEEVAETVGKARATVANSLRLLALDEEVRGMVRSGALSAGHARGLLTLRPPVQRSLAEDAVSQRLSVREVEAAARKIRLSEERARKGLPPKPMGPREKKPAPAGSVESYLEDIAENLSQLYERKVRITGIGGQGKVEFEYYNMSDLKRILEVFLKLTGGDQ